jgi:hypothetical protein
MLFIALRVPPYHSAVPARLGLEAGARGRRLSATGRLLSTGQMSNRAKARCIRLGCVYGPMRLKPRNAFKELERSDKVIAVQYR